MRYVIGVDAGATKSHLAIFDESGVKVGLHTWGPLNHEVLPGAFVQLEEELGVFVNRALSGSGLSFEDIGHAVLGVAGDDTRGQHALITAILERIGLTRFTLANDGFLGVPAGSPTGAGICAINGTGESIAGVNRAGRMWQIGGAGAISADMGGGGDLGRAAVSAVYRQLWRKGERTLLTTLLLSKLGISDKAEFVEEIYKQLEDGRFSVPSCNRLLFEAAAQNDAVAMNILRGVARNYAGGIACMIEELDFLSDGEMYIVLAGSVFVKGEHPLLVDSLKEAVRSHCPSLNINYVVLKAPPVAGAVVWALNTLHGRSGFMDKVCAQF